MQAWSDEMMDRRFHAGVLSGAQREWFATTQAACEPQALLAVGELLVDTVLTAKLSNIAAPTLLLTPDGSPFVTVDLSNQIKQRARFVDWPCFLVPAMASFFHTQMNAPQLCGRLHGALSPMQIVEISKYVCAIRRHMHSLCCPGHHAKLNFRRA